MAAVVPKVDDVIREYLTFRGFSSTLKQLETDLKSDKDKGLKVERLVEQLWSSITSHDLGGLRQLWAHLDHRFFSRLPHTYDSAVKRLEVCLLKMYLVSASQGGRQDKVQDFFSLLTPLLQHSPDWKEWFPFPYIANPSDNATYRDYFTRSWQDGLQLSLYNMMSVVMATCPLPTLLAADEDRGVIRRLQHQNVVLRQQVEALLKKEKLDAERLTSQQQDGELLVVAPPVTEVVDEFSGLEE